MEYVDNKPIHSGVLIPTEGPLTGHSKFKELKWSEQRLGVLCFKMNLITNGVFNFVPREETPPILNDAQPDTIPNITEVRIPPSISSLTSSPLSLLIVGPSAYPISVSQEPAYIYTTAFQDMGAKGSCEAKVPDLSGYNYPGKPTQMDSWEIVVKCAVVGILLLTAFIGNVLIIVIVTFSKKMRSTTNYYIVNLAVADLLVACFPMWIYVTKDVTGDWIVGGFLCKFNAFVQTCAMCTISFTMMAIAGDRFFAIVFPFKARVTQRKVKFVMAAVWLAAISIAVPPAVFYKYTERRWANHVETFCHDVWPVIEISEGNCDEGVLYERVYWTVVVAALNWIPMAMMTINYAIIIHRLHANRVNHNGSGDMSAVQRRSAWRVVRMLFTLLITFMVCTLPFQVVTVYENYKDRKTQLPDWYKPFYFSAITLMYSHSTINPIVYGAMNQTFRMGFRQLIARLRGQKLGYGWESQQSVMESVRRNISVVNNAKVDMKTSNNSLSEIASAGGYVNHAIEESVLAD